MNQAKYADCANCPLNNRPLVRSAGPLDADLIIVGEGPGDTEGLIGKPFVGKTGQVIRQALKKFGQDPNRVFWTNAELCQPSGDKATKDREMPVAIARCQERLRYTLQQIPNKRTPVLALGSWAQKALGIEMPDYWTSEKLTGRQALGTIHPALCLYEPDTYLTLAMSLQKFFHQDYWANIIIPDKSYTLVDETWLYPPTNRTLEQMSEIVIDIETSSFDWTDPNIKVPIVGLAGFVGDAYKAFLFTYPAVVALSEDGYFKNLFINFGYKIGGHNFKYDAHVLHQQFGTPLEFGWDTMIMAAAYKAPWHLSLKDLSTYFYNADAYDERLVKSWLAENVKKKEDRTYDKVPTDRLYEYLNLDLFYNLHLKRDLEHLMKQDGTWRLYEKFDFPLAQEIVYMETRGVVVDKDQWAREQVLLTAEAEQLKQAAVEISSGEVKNPNSAPQVAHYLWDVLQLPFPSGMGKTDKRSTKAAVLEAMEQEGVSHPFFLALMKYRRVNKLLTSYVNNLPGFFRDDGKGHTRVHGTFNQSKVRTGRLSIERPALQTIVNEDERRDGDAHYGARIKNLYVAP